MRTSNSIKNSISAFICSATSLFISFIAQSLFIRFLGVDYLGLNGLFTNILTMLSIFELGIGNAIIFNLYKPISEDNIELIKSLMLFYKKSYRIICITILCFAVFLVPFLKYIVGSVSVDININAIYFLFLISTLCSYLLAYKRNLLYANQKNYIINFIHLIYIVFLNSVQIAIIYLTKNYYLYLIIKIVFQVLENVLITIFANKMYPYLNDKKIKPLDKSIEKDIFKKVKGLLFHKIGSIVVDGTDNILISMLLGVRHVGLYTNYNLIISSVKTVFSQSISSVTPSVGDLLVNSNCKERFRVFSRIRFINFWISTIVSICILLMIEPFISFWIGKEYVLDKFVLIVLIFNFYQKMARNPYGSFKESAGIFVEDRFVPIMESIVNIISSIILFYRFGLAGIFMGTIVSGLCLWCYSYPKFVYVNLFKRSYLEYYKETLGYILLFVSIALLCLVVSDQVYVNNCFLNLVFGGIISITIPNLIIIILFRRTENYIYFIGIIKNLKGKLMRGM